MGNGSILERRLCLFLFCFVIEFSIQVKLSDEDTLVNAKNFIFFQLRNKLVKKILFTHIY